MRLSIVTINYNTSESTIKLMESLKNQTDKDFEVIVVDNNSKDLGELMNYRTSENNMIFINNGKNLGYSGGNNVGIRRALNPPAGGGSDWVLLLNNDTLAESGLVEYIKGKIEDRGGIIGLALDEGDKVAFAGHIEWLKPTLRHIAEPCFCNDDYAIGGAMLIHKDVFDKIGYLDENYFLYFEDADFCINARKQGIPVNFAPEIKIRHAVSSSTKKLGSPLLLRYHYRNAFYFNLKNGPWYIKLLVWPWSLMVALKQIVKIGINKKKEQSLAILKGVSDFYQEHYGKSH